MFYFNTLFDYHDAMVHYGKLHLVLEMIIKLKKILGKSFLVEWRTDKWF